MIEPMAHSTARSVPADVEDRLAWTPVTPSTVAQLSELVTTVERAIADLVGAVPYLGDQETGAEVNGHVDSLIADLHRLRSDADDLRRVIAISEQRSGMGRS